MKKKKRKKLINNKLKNKINSVAKGKIKAFWEFVHLDHAKRIKIIYYKSFLIKFSEREKDKEIDDQFT